MGLTVHYQLSALKLDTATARRAVKQGHALALRRQQAGEFRRVNAVREDVTGHPLARQWVMEALESGVAKPLKMTDLDAAFRRGTKRAVARKAAK